MHIDCAMNNHITTPDLRAEASKLDSDLDEYNNGEDSAAWKLHFDSLEAETRLEEIRNEIALREELEDRDFENYLDEVAASNGR